MNVKQKIRKLAGAGILISVISAAVLTACGGGGGGGSSGSASSTLSGIAAGGAPIVGTVEVKDSKGAKKQGTIAADGKYSVDVTGMTGPFVLKATGKVGDTNVVYYSAATSSGTVNVTPFTNLIVSNIAGKLAENYFGNKNPDSALITAEALNAAKNALMAKLTPALQALGVSTSIDLLRDSFATDHTGIDAALDAIKVSVDKTANIATLKYAGAPLDMDDLTYRGDDATPVLLSPQQQTDLGAASADVLAIVNNMNKFVALFATKLPTIDQIQGLGIFDEVNFMDEGMGFLQWASEISTDPFAIGQTFSSVSVDFDSSTTGTVSFVVQCSTCRPGESGKFKISKASGKWLALGSGTMAGMEVEPASMLNGSTNAIMNGLNVWIDPSAYNGTHQTAIDSASITGPGLDNNGVTLVSSPPNNALVVSGSGSLIPECSPPNTTSCVDLSQVVAGAEYTIVLYAGSTAVNGTGNKFKSPTSAIPTAQLTNGMFPAITSLPALSQLIPNTSIPISWTLPAGFLMNNTNLSISGSGYYRLDKDLSFKDTSTTFALDGTAPTSVSSAGISLNWFDAQGRMLGTYYSLQ